MGSILLFQYLQPPYGGDLLEIFTSVSIRKAEERAGNSGDGIQM